MTLADFRTYIWNHLDLTDDDLSASLLDSFIREGAKLVQYGRQRWHFYENTWTLPTVIGQGAYDLTTDPTDDASLDYVIAEIRHVYRPDGTEVGMQGVGTATGAETSGDPTMYRLWGSTLTLVPTPDSVENLQIVGYRKPVDWVAQGAGAAPDTPDEFDDVIQLWALGRAYSQQEEGAVASYYMDSANFHLARLIKQLDDLPPSRIVMNSSGSKTNYWVGEGSRSLQYPHIVIS